MGDDASRGDVERWLAPEDYSRQVLSRLGADVPVYVIERGVPDWDEVAVRYGERFRGGRLVHLAGTTEFDDSGYVSYGDEWVLAAADVGDAARAVADCFMEEFRLRPFDFHVDQMWVPTYSWYVDRADRSLLFVRGIVAARFAELGRQMEPSLEQMLTEVEWDELVAGRGDRSDSFMG